jgi:hypothetical protein
MQIGLNGGDRLFVCGRTHTWLPDDFVQKLWIEIERMQQGRSPDV